MKREQLAINSVSTRHADLVEALDAYAGAGFRQVEFVLPHVKDWMAAGHSLDDVRLLLAERGLRCIGGFQAHVQCFGDAETRAANLELHLANAQLIHDLGGGTLVVGTDGPPAGAAPADPLAVLEPIAARLAELARRIEHLDVMVALEFNWSPVVKSLASAARVAEQADHPQVGVLFDPAHYYTTPTKFEELSRRSVQWIRHVHLDDMRDKPADFSNCNDDRVLPGEGVVDVRGLIVMLERCGYTGSFSIEMFNADLWALPAAEAARRCYQSLLPYCD